MIFVLIFFKPLFGWQDDGEVNLRNPFGQFNQESGLGFLNNAQGEIRLARYVAASEHQRWRGAVEGDIALLSYGDRWAWHMGLNMETLIDDRNDIYFRLVQVYYQAMTGVKLRLGSGMLHAGLRHRCSHGADRATESRITIRSGLTASYQWVSNIRAVHIDVKPGLNVYILGQNRDLTTQPKGGVFLATQAIWPLAEPLFMLVGLGVNVEMVSQGHKFFYLLTDKVSAWHFEPLWAGRLALRIDHARIKSDFGLNFSQNLDTGIGFTAQKTSALAFAIDFMW